MIDIKLIRENPEIVKENIKKKFQNDKIVLVDKIRKMDEKWRCFKGEADNLRHRRNKISKDISEAKKSGDKKKEVSLLKEAKSIPEEINKVEIESNSIEDEIEKLLMQIPNIIHSSVPLGHDASENIESKKIGKPSKMDNPMTHIEIGEGLKMMDFDSSAKTSGKGFYYLKGDIALLNQALIRFAIEKMLGKGFVYIETPLMLRHEVMSKVSDLNDMKNQIYKTENDDSYLIGTSEHSLIGRFIDVILNEKELPIKNTSYSMCFRKEIGSHGIEEKGLYRTHQFNKVEMIVICKPSDSMKFFEEMKDITIAILENHQNKDGSVNIPVALRPYMFGKKKIELDKS